MTEKNAVDDLIVELIGIHLKKLNTAYSQKCEEQIREVESIINNLGEEDKAVMEQCINDLINRLAEEEVCLYTAGIKDGIKLFHWITTVSKEDT